MSRPSGERGSAAIWVLACCVVLVFAGGVAVLRGSAVLARHRAESAADLAALAAAAQVGTAGTAGSPCRWAARVATANHSRLRSCTLRLDAGGRSGEVRVSVAVTIRLPGVGTRTVVASARAARLPA